MEDDYSYSRQGNKPTLGSQARPVRDRVRCGRPDVTCRIPVLDVGRLLSYAAHQPARVAGSLGPPLCSNRAATRVSLLKG